MSKKFRYNLVGQWFKGNTHLHSTASDGGKTFAELEELYAGGGYDFLFATDHNVTSRVATTRRDAPLIWFDGVELDGKDGTGAYYHVVCLGHVKGIEKGLPLEEGMRKAREQGALLILAHPFWSGNTFEDARRWQFDGVELYNHVCHWLNGKGDGLTYWNAVLQTYPTTLGIASDDAHLNSDYLGWHGGWIMVNARDRSRRAIMQAIRKGNFYASCGPEFHDISLKGDEVTIKTSPVQFARLVGPKWGAAPRGDCGKRDLQEATFKIPDYWEYAYVEIQDRQGRRAWTNTLLV